MADYKSMYTVLCKTVDGVVDNLEKIPLAKKETESLKKALLFAGKYILIRPYIKKQITWLI